MDCSVFSCSRGYLVNFSLGNAKFTDIQVETSDGKQYSVDVKGQSTKGFWLIKQRKPKDNQYYILVYIPRSTSTQGELSPKEGQYFILSSTEMIEEMRRDQHNAERIDEERKKKGLSPLKQMPGIGGSSFNQMLKYADKWENLPQNKP
jgi:hypothetical protein